MAWLYLLAAGVLEIFWVIGLKYTEGFSKLTPTILTVIAMIGSFLCLSLAVKTLPLGSSYAIWTGIGTMGAVLAGMLIFGEQMNMLRLLCVAMILGGIIGLKLTSPA